MLDDNIFLSLESNQFWSFEPDCIIYVANYAVFLYIIILNKKVTTLCKKIRNEELVCVCVCVNWCENSLASE